MHPLTTSELGSMHNLQKIKGAIAPRCLSTIPGEQWLNSQWHHFHRSRYDSDMSVGSNAKKRGIVPTRPSTNLTLCAAERAGRRFCWGKT